jgi:hypothetical protein
VQIGKTFYAKNRREWRAWLAKHHKQAPDIHFLKMTARNKRFGMVQ